MVSMMTSPPSSGDSGDVNPPPYTCLQVSNGEATAAERAWDLQAPRSWRDHKYRNLVFCCTPKIYHEGDKGDNLWRRKSRRGKASPHWRAELLVVARNIPNLMLRANTSFITIFDRMPIGGWWPMPKKLQTTQNVVRFWNWTNKWKRKKKVGQ
ncbi:unnamed protein product [Clonostachys chloroleuca]|uniref:Uncharacterized protein n=1 Tax=Clonostachys chloroleuca TaxID=1926264 RepID=A0AA35MCX8_9HYPO|nr:unnamed protein product [Clonostachys chloroleuca]